MSSEERSLQDLMEVIREFVKERGWEKYHQPESLAVSASIEIGELLELFQWLEDSEIEDYLKNDDYRSKLSAEIADVLIYMIRLADVTGIDPTEAVLQKMKENTKKYPSEKWHERIPSKVKESQ
ncbi:MAG: nucleotide pyrophosphohydrolase [Candidatus Thorarchaeota archaeon]